MKHWFIQRGTALLLIPTIWIVIQVPLFGIALINIILFWHFQIGIEEILADYIHHEMTRNLILMWTRILMVALMKYLFLFIIF
jgi:succinate dehydrogenase hydrophobic anchor subunit